MRMMLKMIQGDRVVRYHTHGQCSTLKAMKNDGRFNRYVLKSKPDGLFVVDCEENQIKISTVIGFVIVVKLLLCLMLN